MSFVDHQALTMLDQKEPILQGTLKKKSPKGFLAKLWQERYFLLYDDVLQYFKSKKDATPLGAIPLQTISGVETLDKKKGCRFDVVVGEAGKDNRRTFCLLADNETEADNWVSKIRALVKKYDSAAGSELDIETRGKFWKNTLEIREARARSTSRWGDQRYAVAEEDNKAESSTSVSDSDDTEKKETSTPTPVTVPVPKQSVETGTLFEAVKMLTEGPYGQIYIVRHISTKTPFLMHVVKKSDPNAASYRQLFKDMSAIDHPYIFSLVHTGETSDTLYAIYTYAVDQSLFVHLRQHRRFPEHVVRLFAAEIVLALGYLHKLGKSFPKLEPENIFLDEDGHACISDFLLLFPINLLSKETQTAEYNTPELLLGKDETPASDWWRLGVFLYELVVGFPPFRSRTHDPDELAQQIITHRIDNLRFPPFLSKEGQDLISQLLQTDPSQRLGVKDGLDAESVKKHPFFADVKWGRLMLRQVESPDWVDEMMQNQRRSARLRTAQRLSMSMPRFYRLSVGVIEARGLPGLKSNGQKSDPYCKISFETYAPQTRVITDTVKPVWDETFHFDISQPNTNSELCIKVHHDDGSLKHTRIGMVTIPLFDIKTAKTLDAWYSIIGQDCIAHGEVHIVLSLTEKPVVRRIETPSFSEKPFAEMYPLVGDLVSSSTSRDSMPLNSTGSPVPPAMKTPSSPRHQRNVSFSPATLAAESKTKGFQGILRGIVSKKKLRFQEDGFDLDLSYITDRLIAMGFPAEKLSGVYRNPLPEVQRFFGTYHPNHYHLFNLCAEAKYDKSKFEGRVSEYDMEDHNCPPFTVLLQVCAEMDGRLQADAETVLAIHCKAGKGRTGCVIGSYLVYSGVCKSAQDALEIFGLRRTSDGKGVTIPSQRRYVEYMQRYLAEYVQINRPFPAQAPAYMLRRVRMLTVPNFDVGGGCDPYFVIKRANGKHCYDYRKHVSEVRHYKSEPFIDMDNLQCPMIGDAKLIFFDKDTLRDDKMFALWINTSFVSSYMSFDKEELDGAVKDKAGKHFSPHFKLELFFEPMDQAAIANSDSFTELDAIIPPDEDEDDEIQE